MVTIIARKFPALAKNAKVFAWGWNLWPPFLGAGIRIDHISNDYKEIDVSMNLGLRNANYVGTHFGGSLYAMTDPFYMIMFMKNLGREYIVWDKSAKIDFLKPGKGRVAAQYRISQEDIDFVKRAVEQSETGKFLWDKTVEVKNEEGDTVARVDKVLYFRKKPPKTV